MKTFILLCTLLTFSFAINAQNCAKACASKSNKSASIETAETQVASVKIAKKVCSPEEMKNCAKACKSKSASAEETSTASLVTIVETKAPCCSPCKADCKHACCDDKGTRVASVRLEADDLAEKREDIEKRECAETGASAYFLNYKCPVTNEMTSAEVAYDSDKKEFVRLVPEEEAAKNCAAKCAAKANKE